jgi:ATP-dependent DNA helicase RecQ
LFWQKKDTGLHAYFIGKIEDPGEKERAWQRYHEVERFVQSKECRQRHVCRHFGETPKWDSCGNCDACSATPDWLELELRAPRRKRDAERKSQATYSPAPRPVAARPVMAMVKTSADIELKEYLREWRRITAREKGVAAFIVLPDSALVDLCLAKPSSLQELRRVSGFGDKRVEMYGQQILDALRRFRQGERASDEGKAKASSPAKETQRLLEEGHTFAEIAQIRGRRVQAVIEMAAKLIERGDVEYQLDWLAAERYNQIAGACQQFGMDRLKPLKEALPPEIPYEEIRLVIARLRSQTPST